MVISLSCLLATFEAMKARTIYCLQKSYSVISAGKWNEVGKLYTSLNRYANAVVYNSPIPNQCLVQEQRR